MVNITKLIDRVARRTATPSSAHKHWRDCEFLVIDIETTGLDPRNDTIVSYGAVPIREGRIASHETHYSLVNPMRPVPGSAIRIHGLRGVDLASAPAPDRCAEALNELMADRILVAHAAWVEAGFLRRMFENSGLRFERPFVDTAQLASDALPIKATSGKSVSLEYAATALRLPVHTPHHALGDAMTTAELFLLLSNRLDANGMLTGQELLRISATLPPSRRQRF